MADWIMVGNHALNLPHVDRITFAEDGAAIVLFNSLEARHCSECGDQAEGLEQAWMVLEGDDATALRRYITSVAVDTRTPVPAVYRHQDT